MTNLSGLTLAAPIPVAGLASDVTLDSIAQGSDITTNNVTISKHGLCPKLPSDATKYLDGTGAYTVPAGGSGIAILFDSTLASPAASIDSGAGGFSTAYATLFVCCIVRGANAVVGSQGAGVTFNNDSGNNYYQQNLNAVDTTVSAGTSLARANYAATIADAGNTANFPTIIALTVPGYSSTTFAKVASALVGFNDSTAGSNRQQQNSFTWNSTAAITRVKVASTTADNFVTGSRLIVYAL